MRTTCPTCHTAFRIRAEQLRVRSGRVRCGNCRTAFNALDKLEDDAYAVPVSSASVPCIGSAASAVAADEGCASISAAPVGTGPTVVAQVPEAPAKPDSAEPIATPVEREEAPPLAPPTVSQDEFVRRPATPVAVSRKWLSGVGGGPVSPARHKGERFVLAAAVLFLTLLLTAQIVFLWRSEIAVAVPGTQPTLEALSEILGSEIPLPRNADLVSIEASDLQNEPGHSRTLVLQTTLRNRASYSQAYPALELTLTDARDKPITRRVFLANEYLPASVVSDPSFPANGEVEVRLWLEAKDIDAAGYRLYVFYP